MNEREKMERAAGRTKVSEGSRVAARGTPSHSAPLKGYVWQRFFDDLWLL